MDNFDEAMRVSIDETARQYAKGHGKYRSFIDDIQESLDVGDIPQANQDLDKLRKYVELRERGFKLLRRESEFML